MRTIYKYPVPLDYGAVDMPRGAEILSVHTQRGLPQMWAIVDPEAPLESRRFHLFGTGHEMPPAAELGRFVGTFLFHDDSLVFHLFEAL